MSAASLVEVKVPDIGDFKEVSVIELLVKAGDTVKVGDKVSEGSVLVHNTPLQHSICMYIYLIISKALICLDLWKS